MIFPPIKMNICPEVFLLYQSESTRKFIRDQAAKMNLSVPETTTTYKAIDKVYSRIKKIIANNFNIVDEPKFALDYDNQEYTGFTFSYEGPYTPIGCYNLWEMRKQFQLATEYLLGRISILCSEKDFYIDEDLKRFQDAPKPIPNTDYEQEILEFADKLDWYAKNKDFYSYISRYNETPNVFVYRGFCFEEGYDFENFDLDEGTNEVFLSVRDFLNQEDIDENIRFLDNMYSYNVMMNELEDFIQRPIPVKFKDLNQVELCLT